MRRGACENEATASRPSVVQGNPQFGRREASRWPGMSLFGLIVGLNWAPLVLADVELQDYTNVKTGYALRQVAIICGAAMLVISPVLLWAVFVRKRRRRRHHHYSQRRAAPNPGEAALLDDSDSTVEVEESSPQNRRRIWKRRRRRDHRPLNPTLAQTGGLPPVRTQPPAGPSA
jgi:hypothetical protein